MTSTSCFVRAAGSATSVKNGDTKATYGYTAYGSDDKSEFTGIDKPDTADPTKEAYNPYRFNAKRWDAQSGTYDMGFRDYNPGLNRFTTRDMYNGALADMSLGSDPYTGNRYAFGGGNPSSFVELDGHRPADCNEPGATCTMNSAGGWNVGFAAAALPGKYGNKTSRHDEAQARAILEIEAQAASVGATDFQVLPPTAIAGANKECMYPRNGNRGTPRGNRGLAVPDCSYGTPDILGYDAKSDVYYVWEVKSAGDASKAVPEAQWYVSRLKAQGKKAVLGWMIGGPYDVGNGDKVMGPEEGAVIYGRQNNKRFQKIYNNSPMAAARRAAASQTPQPSAGPGPGAYPGTAYQPGVGTRPLSDDGGFDPMIIPLVTLGGLGLAGGVAMTGPEVAVGAGAGVVYRLAA